MSRHSTCSGSTISLHHVSYSVKVSNGFFKKPHQMQILHEISGLLKPGLNAIMGPSGGGKTTLLNLMAGRVNMTTMRGQVLVDGMKQPPNFKCLSGFVTQDDIVMGTLTVRENIMFSANTRLPKCISKKEKKEKTQEILYELGLNSCADALVGTGTHRGISGGERKRTNIGMELIISPKVLFLDEPTTGLDSSTATAVIQLLKTLSLTGRTIIFSIHQPCYNIFKLFDSLLLLSSGRVIYNGPANLTLDFFSKIGYICEQHNNPSDFFLDVANGENSAIMAQKGKYESASNGKFSSQELEKNFKNSSQFQSLKDELDNLYSFQNSFYNKKNDPTITFSTDFCSQFCYLSQRAIKNIARSPSGLILQNAIIFLFGLFVGMIYFQLGTGIDGSIQNRVGAFYFIIINQVFGNLSSLELFLKERAVFVHESTSGFYRVSAYFFTKFLFDIFPMRFTPTTLLCLTSYFMMGLQLEAGKFFIYYLTVLLGTISASAIGFAVSAKVNDYGIAHLSITFTFIFMQIFGGFLVNLTTMTKYLSWMQYLSVVRFSLNAMCINELKDIVFYNDTTPVTGLGNEYLRSQGIAYETGWDLWQNEFALLVITVGFLFIAYINLLQKAKSFGK